MAQDQKFGSPLSDSQLKTLAQVIASATGNPAIAAIPGLVDALNNGKLLEQLPSLISKGVFDLDLLQGQFEPGAFANRLRGFLGHLKKDNLLDALAENAKSPPDRCGATTLGNPDKGSVAFNPTSGNHIVMFYIDELPGGKLPMPPITQNGGGGLIDDRNEVLGLFTEALGFWEGLLKIEIAITQLPDKANLIVKGRRGGFGADVVAQGDIGPIFSRKCRLIFNLDAKQTIAEFQYTVAHEFGHCLGIKHVEVAGSGALMSPTMDLSHGNQPTDMDVQAAVKHKWLLR